MLFLRYNALEPWPAQEREVWMSSCKNQVMKNKNLQEKCEEYVIRLNLDSHSINAYFCFEREDKACILVELFCDTIKIVAMKKIKVCHLCTKWKISLNKTYLLHIFDSLKWFKYTITIISFLLWISWAIKDLNPTFLTTCSNMPF